MPETVVCKTSRDHCFHIKHEKKKSTSLCWLTCFIRECISPDLDLNSVCFWMTTTFFLWRSSVKFAFTFTLICIWALVCLLFLHLSTINADSQQLKYLGNFIWLAGLVRISSFPLAYFYKAFFRKRKWLLK